MARCAAFGNLEPADNLALIQIGVDQRHDTAFVPEVELSIGVHNGVRTFTLTELAWPLGITRLETHAERQALVLRRLHGSYLEGKFK